MTVETFNSSTTWTCPSGVTSVDIECWGSGATGATGSFFGGQGGGAGAYAAKTALTVTPGNSYAIIVALGNGGGSSLFDAGADCKAASAGVDATAGGLASNCIGDTKNSGGSSGFTFTGDGTGGGGAGGSNGAGGDSSGLPGGIAGTGGGDGGAAVTGAVGNPGNAPGGGGGGGANGFAGGVGSAGRIKLTYTAAGGGGGDSSVLMDGNTSNRDDWAQ